VNEKKSVQFMFSLLKYDCLVFADYFFFKVTLRPLQQRELWDPQHGTDACSWTSNYIARYHSDRTGQC